MSAVFIIDTTTDFNFSGYNNSNNSNNKNSNDKNCSNSHVMMTSSTLSPSCERTIGFPYTTNAPMSEVAIAMYNDIAGDTVLTGAGKSSRLTTGSENRLRCSPLTVRIKNGYADTSLNSTIFADMNCSTISNCSVTAGSCLHNGDVITGSSICARDIVNSDDGIHGVDATGYKPETAAAAEQVAVSTAAAVATVRSEAAAAAAIRPTVCPMFARLYQTVAFPLPRSLTYHVFFLHHSTQRDWVYRLMERLESPALGFLCSSLQDQKESRTLPHATLYQCIDRGVRSALKTVVVVSPEFLTDIWSNVSDNKTLSGADGAVIQRDVITLTINHCDAPAGLFDVANVDVDAEDDWWARLISLLTAPRYGPWNARLVTSLKSRCRCCGQELIDPNDLPPEFLAYGITIRADEYSSVIGRLMSDNKFKCHVWCYNVPGAIVCFTCLLCLSLVLTPILETRWLRYKVHAGLEYVHAVVVWLCFLTLYLLAMNISKRQMKRSANKQLRKVNACLIKHNLLAGIENLGFFDCNKYHLHFFYYEIGPCLATLQETLSAAVESRDAVTAPSGATRAALLRNGFHGGRGVESGGRGEGEWGLGGGGRMGDAYTGTVVDDCLLNGLGGDDEEEGEGSDGVGEVGGRGFSHGVGDYLSEGGDKTQEQALDRRLFTNIALQTHTEQLILEHSGEYVTELIAKRLERCRRSRHVLDRTCLCQYIEQRTGTRTILFNKLEL